MRSAAAKIAKKQLQAASFQSLIVSGKQWQIGSKSSNGEGGFVAKIAKQFLVVSHKSPSQNRTEKLKMLEMLEMLQLQQVDFAAV